MSRTKGSISPWIEEDGQFSPTKIVLREDDFVYVIKFKF
jgi:hypothetical protein